MKRSSSTRRRGRRFDRTFIAKKNHIPEHFADGGYPVVSKDQESCARPFIASRFLLTSIYRRLSLIS